mgnify:CR=1 FL=1|jgi:hypothetical protein
MKISDVLENFSINTSNEERALLQRLNGPRAIEDFTERERFILENLIRKSLVTKISNGRSFKVEANKRKIKD